jgi:asparaginyl-tRNA synthetase
MKNNFKAGEEQNNSTKYLALLYSDKWFDTLTKLQNEFIEATVAFYSPLHYRFVMLPVTTNTISSPMGLGSDSLPVKINIKGTDTFLIDSAQFYLELACRINRNGAYYIAPSFRGEPTDERHLSQFFHSEVEIVGTLEDIISLGERYFKHLVKYFLNTCESEIANIVGNTDHLIHYANTGRFEQITFENAYRKLEKNNTFVKTQNEIRTITAAGEKELIKIYNGAVWLTHFDHKSVPFYQSYADKTHQKANNADLLVGPGEILGCGQRHYSAADTSQALKEHHTPSDHYDWYLKMKNLVPLQTSGFGLGVERFFLFLLNHKDIRDLQLIPRYDDANIVI